MLLVAPQAQAATRQVGIDIPVQWYADASGQMTIDRFAALPTDQLATTRQIPSFGYSRKTWWLRSELPGTWFAGEPRWLQLGPSFVDHLTIYYRPLGSDAPWDQRTFGDRDVARESDLHYRESVLIIPPPPTAAGYEVVFRLQSTSTLILLASLSSAQVFVQRATADTAFWSFYFGLAAVASGVALWLALALRRRLLWGICLFSLNYPLVAALHGFPEWFFGHAALPFQDFMISSLSLFSYATALWLHSEIFDLKKNMPRLHQLLIAAVVWIVRSWPRAPRRLAPTWTCGMTPTSRFDYTATAFAKPLRLIFAAIYRPRRDIARESGSSPYVVSRLVYKGEVVDLAETVFYARLKRWITNGSQAIRARSTGRIHGYIGFVLITLIVALLLFGRG